VRAAHLLDEVAADAPDDLEEVVVVEAALLVHPEGHVLVAGWVLAEGLELGDLALLVYVYRETRVRTLVHVMICIRRSHDA
jgi:hypothetical protein